MFRPKYHRPFLFASLLLISLGSLLGAGILANLCGWYPRENWTNYVSAHANTQVFGFVVLFTMGIAHQLLRQIYGRQRGPRWMYFSLATVLPGTAVQAGILVFWNLGLLNFLGAPWPADLGFLGAAGLLHTSLRPLLPGGRPSRSPSWLRGYIRLAYAWLAMACLMRVAQDLGWQGPGVGGATQHALASGFILTMMMGMGFRLVPSFEGQELRSIRLPQLCLALLGGSTVLRVAAQSLLGTVEAARSLGPWAGLGQARAVILFALTLLDVMLRASSKAGLAATIQRTTVDVART